LLEKAEYHDLYLDLVFSLQTNRNYIIKRCLKEDSEDFPKDLFYYLDKFTFKKKIKGQMKKSKNKYPYYKIFQRRKRSCWLSFV